MSFQRFSDLIEQANSLGIFLRAKDDVFVVMVNNLTFSYKTLDEVEAFISGFKARAS